jgi:AcrR family transcriptional regulator
MKRRAELVEQTRLRITEAAVDLHGTIGPAKTTITAIAAQAGVDRLTVYRHFPTEDALLDACSAHWRSAHPLPDPAGWATAAAPEARLRQALTQLYAWYRENHAMMENVLRDAPDVAPLADRPRRWADYNRAVVDALVPGWKARGRRARLLRAALGHAVALGTWRSLTSTGLDDDTAAELMLGFVGVSIQQSSG